MAPKQNYNEPMAIAQAIQELLQTHSATELGAALGVEQSTVSRWGSGKLVPEPWRADAIATVLNKETGEVELMIFEAKRARSRPLLEQRVAKLEATVEELKQALLELARKDAL